jgi:hypothetical protein
MSKNNHKDRERREKSCINKVRHPAKLGALIALRKMKNAQLEAYHCSFCGGWHTGHSSSFTRVHARLDQLLGKPKEESS